MLLEKTLLSMLSVGSMAAGILMIVYRPQLWLMDGDTFVVMGVMLALFGFMLLPGLIYRISQDLLKKSDAHGEP